MSFSEPSSLPSCNITIVTNTKTKEELLFILKSLKKNEAVVFVMDQFMGPPIGVRTTFFGHETGSAMGLAVMAQRSKVPVVPVYTYRDDNGDTHIILEPPIPFEDKVSET